MSPNSWIYCRQICPDVPAEPFRPARPHSSERQTQPVDRRPRDFHDGSGAHLLGNHILPFVRIECAKCNRRGQYSTAKLLAKYGPHQQMPELRWLLSKCTRKEFTDYCGVSFTDAQWLAGMTDALAPPWTVQWRMGTPPQLFTIGTGDVTPLRALAPGELPAPLSLHARTADR